MKKILWVGLVVLVVFSIAAGYFGFVLFSNLNHANKEVKLRVRQGWSMEKMAQELGKVIFLSKEEQQDIVVWANRLGYEKVKACFIQIPAKSSLYDIVKNLKENRKQTRNLVIKGSWDARTLAEAVAANMEVTADTLFGMLTKSNGTDSLGFNDKNWPAFFIPNTYNFYVSDNLEVFLKRMQSEKEKFWSESRKQKALEQGLDREQVAIIASIVNKESNKTDEYENIAGVYINRLRKNMLLQADPTVVFARKHNGRVLGTDLKIESPYNTYLHKGLPPGPICIPNVAAYDAVLNYGQHTYLYFCAKADFSGYHNFAETWEAHLANARAFHRALNARK